MPLLRFAALLLLATGACSFTPGTLAPSGARRVDGGGSGVSDFVSIDGTHNWTTETTVAGFSGAGYVQALPSNTGPCKRG